MAPESKKAKKTTQAKSAGSGNSGSKKPQKGRSDQKGQAKKDGWEWAPFTVKAVAFNQAAKTLAAGIESLYGKNVSITQFEKFCVAADSMPKEERDLVHVDKYCLQALQNYIKARDERDSERASFRSDVAVKDVEGALGSLLTSISGTDSVPTGQTPQKPNGSREGEVEEAKMDA
jgi:hypothetical protein